MFRKSSMIALAAAAAFGVAMLNPVTAGAKGGMGGGGGGGSKISGGGMKGGGGGAWKGGGGIKGGGIKHPGKHGHGHGHGHGKHAKHAHHHHHHHHKHKKHWHYRYGFGYVSPIVVGSRPVVYSATPTVNRCTCLTKEYTPEGAVLFKDVCTNEAAMNPPVQASVAPQAEVAR
jgi:hypothetical protein